MKRFNSTS